MVIFSSCNYEGKVTMVVVDELGSTGGSVNSEKGCFVMWQMVPDKWQIELVLSGQKVVAGSNGAIAWRHTPWLGVHAAKGGVRPLRRALQASSSSSSCVVLNFPTNLVLCLLLVLSCTCVSWGAGFGWCSSVASLSCFWG